MAKTIELNAFEKAFTDALPGHASNMKAKIEEKGGEFMPQSLASLGDVSDTFCSSWPKIRGFVNMAVSALGWFRPKEAAMAKAFLTAVNQTIVPALCGAAAGEVPPAPKPKTNFNQT